MLATGDDLCIFLKFDRLVAVICQENIDRKVVVHLLSIKSLCFSPIKHPECNLGHLLMGLSGLWISSSISVPSFVKSGPRK